MIYIKNHRSVYPVYKIGNELRLNAAGIEHKSYVYEHKIGTILNSVEQLAPLAFISIPFYFFSKGFFTEAGKVTFTKLIPHIVRMFAKISNNVNEQLINLKHGKRKFITLKVAAYDDEGAKITFLFTLLDEEQYIAYNASKGARIHQ